MTARVKLFHRSLAGTVGALAVLGACSSSTEPKCAVTAVSVTPSPTSIAVGQTSTLGAAVTSSNCTAAPTISWSSGGTGVTVSGSGTSAQITGVTASGTPVAVTATALGVSGSSQVTVTTPPSIAFLITSLSFVAVQGGANPASQAIAISNGGGGTLSGLNTGTITYSAGASGWLQTPSFSSTTAPSNLAIQPTTGALAPGVYTATVPVQATFASNSPRNLNVTFTVSTSGPSVAAYAGAGQTGLIGFALNVAPAVRLTLSGVPVANTVVTFAVQSGGGSIVGSSTVNTDGNGVAQLQGWTIGGTPGTNTLTATAAGSGIAGNPVTFTATGEAAAFNITIQNVGPAFSPAGQTAFDLAVAKWQQVIYRDIPDVTNFSYPAGACGPGSPAIGPITVDDVLIFARIDSIDGPGGILGQAGACSIRSGSGLPILGAMIFDSADIGGLIAAGQLNNVIVHEMGHVIGFGSIWSLTQINCLQNPSAPPGSIFDTYFSCPKALAMFDAIGGTSYTGGSKVPVENCGPASPSGCGAGTVNSHWREPTFGNELMTGYLNSGVNPLSKLTAAAMEDLGYGVNYAGADAYTRVFTLRAGDAPNATVLSLGDDVFRGTIYVMDPHGRVVAVLPPR